MRSKKDEKKRINPVAIVILILIITVIAVVAVLILNKNKKRPPSQELLDKYGVDPNNEAYKDMEIYEQDGDIIIESKDGGKTINTTKTKEDTNLKETTEEQRNTYKITDVKVENLGSSTVVSGKVQNTNNKSHEIVVNVKFYSAEQKVVGSASQKLTVDANKTEEFVLTTMGDVSKNKYEVVVEYAD